MSGRVMSGEAVGLEVGAGVGWLELDLKAACVEMG